MLTKIPYDELGMYIDYLREEKKYSISQLDKALEELYDKHGGELFAYGLDDDYDG
jgi:hypothetical protein